MVRIGLLAVAAVAVTIGAAETEAQTVVDARGKYVGEVYGPYDNFGVSLISRRINNSIVVYFQGSKAGFRKNMVGLEYYYTTPDCTGARYVFASSDALIDEARFVPADPTASPSISGKFIVPGLPAVSLILASSNSPATDPPLQCQQLDPPEQQLVRPVMELDTSTWNLKLPLRIK